jgi:hypothetical protein
MLPQVPSDFSNYKRSKKLLVGAVGIEFAGESLSPVGSIDLALSLPLEIQLRGRVLCPRCDQFPKIKTR